MGVANWFRNIFKGQETLDAHNLESKVDITFKVDGIDYFLVLMVLDKKLVKYVYFKEYDEETKKLEIKDVDLEDPINTNISIVTEQAIVEFMKL